MTLRKRRVQAIEWKEPKRNGGPDMTPAAVAKELGFANVERIHQLAEDGPEKDGLAAYYNPGTGWSRKYGRGREYTGYRVFFYREDVLDWKERHPFQDFTRKIHYTPEQKAIVLKEAEAVKYPNGSVNRSRVIENLAYVPGTYDKNSKKGIPRKDPGYGPRLWNTRTYKIVKAVLDDEGYALPPEQPNDTMRRRVFNIRRSAS
jgi:hypothetical protein